MSHLPPAIARRFESRASKRAVVAVGLVALLLAPQTLEPPWGFLTGFGLVTGMVVLSLVVVTGMSGQISLAQAGIMGIGAFGGQFFAVRHGLTFWPTLPLVALLGMLVAAAISIPALRIRGIYLAVVTWVFGMIVDRVILKWEWFAAAGSEEAGFAQLTVKIDRPSFFGISLEDDKRFVYLMLVFVALTLMLVRNLSKSGSGVALRLQRDAELAANACGLSVWRLRVGAFVVSGGIAATAGYLMGALVIAATSLDFTQFTSLNFMLVLVLAGMEAYWAIAVIGVFFGLAPEINEKLGINGQWQWLVFGLAAMHLLATKYGNKSKAHHKHNPTGEAEKGQSATASEPSGITTKEEALDEKY